MSDSDSPKRRRSRHGPWSRPRAEAHDTIPSPPGFIMVIEMPPTARSPGFRPPEGAEDEPKTERVIQVFPPWAH